jgi:hypothetical protein
MTGPPADLLLLTAQKPGTKKLFAALNGFYEPAPFSNKGGLVGKNQHCRALICRLLYFKLYK